MDTKFVGEGFTPLLFANATSVCELWGLLQRFGARLRSERLTRMYGIALQIPVSTQHCKASLLGTCYFDLRSKGVVSLEHFKYLLGLRKYMRATDQHPILISEHHYRMPFPEKNQFMAHNIEDERERRGFRLASIGSKMSTVVLR